jgi:hypothetical protein
MGRPTTQPLTPEEAKARLRSAAMGGQVFSWLWRSPLEAVLVAFISGVIIGVSATARDALVSGVLGLLRSSRSRTRPRSKK